MKNELKICPYCHRTNCPAAEDERDKARRKNEMMERLTKIFNSGRAFIEAKDNDYAMNRLAAYEDTGLTPAEITALKSENERLREQLERAYEAFTEHIKRNDACKYCKIDCADKSETFQCGCFLYNPEWREEESE